jgi:hypothetical protein
MWTEYARQSRWGHDPEPVDEDQVPPGSVYIKQVIWVACNECDLQVHSTFTHSLTEGINCPVCGSPLNLATVPSTPHFAASTEQAAKVLQEEDEFREKLRAET